MNVAMSHVNVSPAFKGHEKKARELAKSLMHEKMEELAKLKRTYPIHQPCKFRINKSYMIKRCISKNNSKRLKF